MKSLSVKAGEPCDVYLAAPFFNPVQVLVVNTITIVLQKTGTSYFSPYENAVCAPDASQEVREKVYNENLMGIDACKFLLAVLEYSLPDDKSAMVLSNVTRHPMTRADATGSRAVTRIQADHVADLMQPDLGVTFEMGYSVAQSVPVIGYLPHHTPHNVLNLMLAEACTGIIQGPGSLERYLNTNDQGELKRWQSAIE